MKVKVVNEKFKDLSEAVAKCWEGVEDFGEDEELKVGVTELDKIIVTVSREYDYLPLTFTIMMKLADVFGTTDYTVNNWKSNGCITCDYGSQYTHEFKFRKK